MFSQVLSVPLQAGPVYFPPSGVSMLTGQTGFARLFGPDPFFSVLECLPGCVHVAFVWGSGLPPILGGPATLCSALSPPPPLGGGTLGSRLFLLSADVRPVYFCYFQFYLCPVRADFRSPLPPPPQPSLPEGGARPRVFLTQTAPRGRSG